MGKARSEMTETQIELKEVDRIIEMIETEGKLTTVLNSIISKDEETIVESL